MEMVTKEEKQLLEKRLADLIANRPVISKRIAEARELGDLKENGDYHAAREEQGLNEAKIRELEMRLRTAQVAADSAVPEGMVFLGAVVRLEDTGSGKRATYKLVGNLSDDDSDHIEVTSSSPLGVALMKSRVGETVRANLPKGEKHFKIVEIVG